MGYLDNTTVTVDAILTNKGRQILANGGRLNITKFALSDDEVDYGLWNPAHSLGTNYYGSVIENMPILEASPDETQMLRYKLVTLPKSSTNIPQITVIPSSQITFRRMGDSVTLTVNVNVNGANSSLGYTAILSDDTVCSIEASPDSVLGMTTAQQPANAASAQARMAGSTPADASPTVMQANTQATFSSFLDDEVGSITTSGNTITRTSAGKFVLKAKGVIGTKSALVTFIANETGGFKTIVVTATDTLTAQEAPNANMAV